MPTTPTNARDPRYYGGGHGSDEEKEIKDAAMNTLTRPDALLSVLYDALLTYDCELCGAPSATVPFTVNGRLACATCANGDQR